MLYAHPDEAHRQAGVPVQGRSWSDAAYGDENLAGIVWENCEFERVRFERADLRQTVFVNCRFDDCEFLDCRLGETLFSGCSGAGAAISGGELYGVVIAKTQWERLAIARTGRNCVLSESGFGEIEFNGKGARQRALTLSGGCFERL
ncbi:MAG: pentapeptide repeat-containing protein, partial [Gammaproteobacteria bacterium]|nr:pentapeptide repeat-containing protein [Gammaproteobacteria bacterium]